MALSWYALIRSIVSIFQKDRQFLKKDRQFWQPKRSTIFEWIFSSYGTDKICDFSLFDNKIECSYKRKIECSYKRKLNVLITEIEYSNICPYKGIKPEWKSNGDNSAHI